MMKHLKKVLIAVQIAAIALLFTTSLPSYAIKAYPGTIVVSQPDGTALAIKVHGDEFFNYATTQDGYTIAQGKDGFFYFADYNTGKLQISNVRVGNGNKMFGGTKGVPQNIIQQKVKAAREEFSKTLEKQEPRDLQQILSQKGKTKAAVMTRHLRIPVILVQYKDIKFQTTSSNQAFDDFFNKPGYSSYGATGSVADYFKDNSMGDYTPIFQMSPIVTLPMNRVFYGNTAATQTPDIRKVHAVEALKLAQTAGMDFSSFDADGDGTVDAAIIIYAGGNAAEGVTQAVWPHKWSIKDQNLTLNGKKFDVYSCSSELKGATGTNRAGIGTMVHEFGHVIGLPDFYDVGYSGGTALWGSLSVMDGGGYNNSGNTPPYYTATERFLLDWGDLYLIDAPGDYTIEPTSKNESYIMLTGNNYEYYILETRKQEGWDKYIGYGDPTGGLMITHFDQSKTSGLVKISALGGASANAYYAWAYACINGDPAHQCVDLVEACGNEWQNQPTNNALFPGGKNNTAFGPATTPNNKSWTGLRNPFDLSNIKFDGNVVTFTVTSSAYLTGTAIVGGKVSDHMGMPIGDATVSVYAAAAAPSPAKKLDSGLSYTDFNLERTKSGTPIATSKTSFGGTYEILNLPAGDYSIEFSATEYRPVTTSITLVANANTASASLIPEKTNPKLTELKWHNYMPSRNLTYTGGPILIGTKFAPEDHTPFTREIIKGVKVATNSYAGATLRVYSTPEGEMPAENNLITTKIIPSSVPGYLYFDLFGEEVIKESDKTLWISVEFSNYNPNTYFTVLDGMTRGVTGKSALLSFDGISWGNLSIPGCWLISVDLVDPATVDDLSISATQHEVRVSWTDQPETLASQWLVKWKKITETTFQEQTVDKNSIIIRNLAANQAYDIQVGAIVKEGKEPSKYNVSTFTTGIASAPFPGLMLDRVSYQVGDEMFVSVKNMEENNPVADIIYKVNNREIDGSMVFASTGTYTVIAEVVYATGKKEILTRKINVQ